MPKIPKNKPTTYFDIKVKGEGGRCTSEANSLQIESIIKTKKRLKEGWKK